MSNPITPTVVETLLITDTGANALVVGGAIGATTGTGGIKAGPIVSSSSIADSVGTIATVRAGGIGIPSQAALDLITASSATQFARTAAGTSLQAPRINAAGNGWEFYSPLMTLIKEGAGTATAGGAANVDTFALNSTLTLKDTLMVVVRYANTGSAATINPLLYNSTDSVTISIMSGVNNTYSINTFFIGAQTTTKIATNRILMAAGDGAPGVTATFTTAWTGAWTLAFRHGGITGPDTLVWEWAIYKIPGQ
jgi:hypothetical protein